MKLYLNFRVSLNCKEGVLECSSSLQWLLTFPAWMLAKEDAISEFIYIYIYIYIYKHYMPMTGNFFKSDYHSSYRVVVVHKLLRISKM